MLLLSNFHLNPIEKRELNQENLLDFMIIFDLIYLVYQSMNYIYVN
jgi:hypothetical protein